MPKVILLLKRAAGSDPVAFQARWLAERPRLVSAVPGVRRYVQSHALLQGYARGDLLFDGIEELWFDDGPAAAVAMQSAAWKRLVDGADGLLAAGRTVVMPVDVHVIKDGAIPAGAVKNIEFVNRRPGMALAPFRRYWREVHGPIASGIPPLQRYEQNHLAMSTYAADAEPPYDGLAITWFHSTADMRAGTTTPAYRRTRADEPNFLPDGHLPIIITREHEIDPATGEAKQGGAADER